MTRRRQFRPSGFDRLESRVVPSQGAGPGSALIESLLQARLAAPQPAAAPQVHPYELRMSARAGGSLALPGNVHRIPTRPLGRARGFEARIDQAFASFQADYLEAQQVFLEALNGSSVDAARNSFTTFINQRTSLLAQDLTQTLGRIPGALNKLTQSQRSNFGGDTALAAFLNRRITGGDSGTDVNQLTGDSTPPLRAALVELAGGIPEGASTAEITLYNLTAINAIESSRVTTINSAKFLASGQANSKKGW